MSTRTRAIFIASLALNVILLVVLFAGRGGSQPDSVASVQVTVVVTPTFTPTSEGQAQGDEGDEAAEAPVTAEPLPQTNTPSPTLAPPTATSTPLAPSPTPTASMPPTPTPSPTLSPTPSPTPEPTAMPTPTVVPGPDWLVYLNRFRVEAGVPQVGERVEWSEGSLQHSVYMMNTGQIWHGEDPGSQWFSQAGHNAAENGNLAVSGWFGAPINWPIDYWVSATFHLIPTIDPALAEVGYGFYYDENASFKMTGTMDIKSGLGSVPASVTFPLTFPRDGGQAWVLKYALPEFPDPLHSCPGYVRPTGAPIVIQMGPGDLTPTVNALSLRSGGEDLARCFFTESTYVSSNAGLQASGRQILNERDAVVIIPRQPLVAGQTYEVEAVVDGQTIAWSFAATTPP